MNKISADVNPSMLESGRLFPSWPGRWRRPIGPSGYRPTAVCCCSTKRSLTHGEVVNAIPDPEEFGTHAPNRKRHQASPRARHWQRNRPQRSIAAARRSRRAEHVQWDDPRVIPMLGVRCCKLLVVERAGSIIKKQGAGMAIWHCVCDCGAKTIVPGWSLPAVADTRNRRREYQATRAQAMKRALELRDLAKLVLGRRGGSYWTEDGVKIYFFDDDAIGITLQPAILGDLDADHDGGQAQGGSAAAARDGLVPRRPRARRRILAYSRRGTGKPGWRIWRHHDDAAPAAASATA